MKLSYNEKLIERHTLRKAIEASLKAIDLSRRAVSQRRSDWQYGYYKAADRIRGMMVDLSGLNESIKKDRLEAKHQSKALNKVHDEILEILKYRIGDLHWHFSFETRVGETMHVGFEENARRHWMRPIVVTLKHSWYMRVGTKIEPMVKFRGKNVLILDAEPHHSDKLEPGAKMYKVKALKVTKNKDHSYGDKPRLEILDLFYTHVETTDGKVLEPAVSPKEYSAINVANRRAVKALMGDLMNDN